MDPATLSKIANTVTNEQSALFKYDPSKLASMATGTSKTPLATRFNVANVTMAEATASPAATIGRGS